MLDLLLAAVVLPLIVALALAVLAALTLAPFVVALEMADARRFSPTRWGAVALGASVCALLVTLLGVRSGLPSVLALAPLLLTWLGPGLLWLLTGEQAALGGRAGAHE